MSVVLASCVYELDADYRLVSVDQAWSDFAVANGAPELAGSASLGRSLFSFISDPTTAYMYQQILERVAQTGESAWVPIRCDAPGLRRFLDIHITPREPSGFVFRSVVSRVEARTAVRLLDAGSPRTDDPLLRMCSWCKDVETPSGWCPAEDAVVRLGLFEAQALPDVTHGICPACFEQVSASYG